MHFISNLVYYRMIYILLNLMYLYLVRGNPPDVMDNDIHSSLEVDKIMYFQ